MTGHPGQPDTHGSSRAANNCTSYLDAISHKSEINLITRRVTPDFSSDLSMGRRPTSKSDEKSGVTLLIVELQRCRKDDFGQKCCSYWRRDPASTAAVPAHRPICDQPLPAWACTASHGRRFPWPRTPSRAKRRGRSVRALVGQQPAELARAQTTASTRTTATTKRVLRRVIGWPPLSTRGPHPDAHNASRQFAASTAA